MGLKSLVAILSFVFLGVAMGGRASAAAPTGITVSPAFQLVTIRAGSDIQPVSFKITNNEPQPQNLTLSVRDFNTLNESGGLFFVGTNPTALQKKYGLAKWLSLPTVNLTIRPHQTITVDGQIKNLSDLSAGGHYGALMISLVDGLSNDKVGFNPVTSSLLFVTKPQGAQYQLDLSNVNFKHSLVSLPKTVTLRFKNTGNVHVVPRGSVYINNPGGRLVSKGIINENSSLILPGSFRQYTIKLNEVASPSAIGSYRLHVDFRFDGINQYRGYRTSFYVIPPWLAGGLLLLVTIILVVGIKLGVKRRQKRRSKMPKHISVEIKD